MSDNHLFGDEFLSTHFGVSGAEKPTVQQRSVDEVDELNEQEEQQINTLSPGPRRRSRFPQASLSPGADISDTESELLKFRMMLVTAKSKNQKSTLQLESITPSKLVAMSGDMAKRPNSPIVTSSRLNSMSNDTVYSDKRGSQLRDLKDLNLLLLGIAFGSVLLLAAVVLYMYIQY